MHRFLLKIIQMVLLWFFLFSLQAALAGTFMNLEPGVSTKADVDRVMGKPTKIFSEGERYDYEKKETQTQRISVKYYSKRMVVQRIDIYPLKSNTKTQYKSWFELKEPQKKSFDSDGNLVEYYTAEGIALNYDGPDDTAGVRFFTHFDPASLAQKHYPPKKLPKAPYRQKDAQFYIDESDNALAKRNWNSAKNLIMEGLGKYPNNAELWHSLAAYYIKCKSEPRQKRISEAKNSMFRAYKLNPSGSYAADMGWLHKEFHNDCTLALSYFEEAEQKGYAEERPDLLYWMGTCFEKIGMYASAKTYYHRFLNAAGGHKKQSEAEIALDRLQGY